MNYNFAKGELDTTVHTRTATPEEFAAMQARAAAVQTEFNDYLRSTRAYLKNYRKMQSAITYWKNERREIEDRLQSVGAATAKYGDMPSGGYSELNNLERQAEDRLKLRKQLDTIEHDIYELSGLIRKLDNAVATLDNDMREAIRMHYIDGKTWYDVADSQFCSYESMRQKGNRAVRDIARLIFHYDLAGTEQVVLFPACG